MIGFKCYASLKFDISLYLAHYWSLNVALFVKKSDNDLETSRLHLKYIKGKKWNITLINTFYVFHIYLTDY